MTVLSRSIPVVLMNMCQVGALSVLLTTTAAAAEPYKKSVTTYSVPDSYGRVATTTTTTDLFPNDAANVSRYEQLKQTVTRTYAAADTANKWVQLDAVTCQVSTFIQKTTGETEQNVSQRMAWRYDAKGRLWKEITEPTATDCVTESNHTLTGRLVTETLYHSTGNVASSAILSGFNITPQALVSYTYDVTGSYAASTTNTLGHTNSKVINLATGTVTSQKDINLLSTSWGYDSFGREITSTTPEGVQTKTTYNWCEGDASCPANALYQIKTEVTHNGLTIAPTTISYYDSLERVLKSKEQRSASTWAVTSNKVYNALGQLEKEATPYFEGETVYWTNYSYDVLGRPQQIISPQGTKKLAYAHLKTVETNEKSQKKTVLLGIHQQPRTILDAENNALTSHYTPLGHIAKTTDALGNTRTYVYDNVGNKLKDKDPDLGEWTYTYDGLNQVRSQLDTKGKTSTMTYDKLGRLVTRLEADLNSTWTYDTANKGIGKIASETSSNGYSRSYSYDSLSRNNTVTTTMDSTSYTTSNTYDSAGRANSFIYPTGIGYKNSYDAYGLLSEVREVNSAALYWKAIKRNAQGKITEEQLGNGLSTKRTYKPSTGYIDTIQTGVTAASFTATVQNDSYTFDSLGNLTFRNEALNNVAESFGYDTLNRLTSATRGSDVRSVKYDALGRIYYKSEVGYYSYGQAITVPNPSYNPNWTPYNTWIPIGMGNGTPIFVWGAVTAPSQRLTVSATGTCGGIHRVCGIAGTLNTTFAYDANGNMTSGNGRNYTWMSFNMPASITQGSNSESFLYNANHERIKRTSVDNGQTTTTYYLNPRLDLGGTFEKNIKPDNSVEYVHHIYAGGQAIGSVVTTGNYSAPTPQWTTDLSVAPTTASPNSIGLTLPAVDTNGFITWDNTTGNGRLAFTTKAVAGSVYALAQRSYLNDNIVFKGEVTTTTNVGNGRYLLMEVYNGGNDAAASKTNRRHGVYFRSGSLYAYYVDGIAVNSTTGNLTPTSKLIGAISNNTTYVAEVETTPMTSVMYVYPKGQTRAQGYSHSLDMDWRSLNGTGTLTRRMRVFAYGAATESVNTTYLDNVSESKFIAQGTRYFHTDHLGSISAVTNAAGNVVERFSYDAWGKRRATTGVDASGIKSTSTKHGFTGHESLDTIGLVHMNGRVYDPVVGRFVSADPHIDGVNDLQGYNTYSYVKNNPLSFTDLTGFYINIPTFTIPMNPMNNFRFEIPNFTPRFSVNVASFTMPTSVSTRNNNFNFAFQAPSINLAPRPTTLSTSQVISNSNAYGRANGNSFLKTGYNATAEGGAGSAKNNYEFTVTAAATGAILFAVDKVVSSKIPVVGSKLTDGLERLLKGGNPCSFDASTPVWTERGLLAIGLVSPSLKVLAFDELTQTFGYQTVTDVFKHQDERITTLVIVDPETAKEETIVTTPNHPFYVEGATNDKARPKIVGHEELGRHWVGAGDLQVGDKVKQADGTIGVVRSLSTIPQSRLMYNLTVDKAHTFFVGNGGWLVHNACNPAIGANNTLDWQAVVPTKGIYKGQNREDHVRLHNIDNPIKPNHGVFYGDGVNLTNEAWLQAQKNGLKSDGDGNLFVPMNKLTGRAGGGKADTGELFYGLHIKLVPGTNKIITSYPGN